MALDLAELRHLAQDELQAKYEDLKKQLLDFRVQLHTGKLEKYHRLGELKRDIARVLTVQKELERKRKAESRK